MKFGKKADIIIINTDDIKFAPENDIITDLVYTCNGADVETTIIDGKIVMENRQILNSSEEKVKEEVIKNSDRLLK